MCSGLCVNCTKKIILFGSYAKGTYRDDSDIDIAVIFEKVEGSFLKRETDVIAEDGKPVVYLFTSSTCPHCEWEKPVLQEVVDKFGDAVIYKQLEDSAEEQEVYSEYGNGGVPLVILGGKYYREGAGEVVGEEKEKEVLTKYICELTGNQPESICQ